MVTPPKRKPPPTPPKAPPKQAAPVAPAKTFAVKPWTGAGEGEKVVVYGDTGLGKTTILTMMPSPIFIGLDDGGRKIVNPKTGEPIDHIPDIETFEDVRAVLQQVSLFPKGSSCVIDTVTMLEQIIQAYVLETVPLSQGGTATNIKSYGWNEGSSHILDAFRLILQDLDALIRRGVNVGLIAQEQAVTIANPEGQDYLQACPRLHHDKTVSVMKQVCEWADHIFRINYLNTAVRSEGKKTTGKVASRDVTRAVYIGGALDFRAKSRTLGRFTDENGELITCVSFETPADDSIWTFLFGE